MNLMFSKLTSSLGSVCTFLVAIFMIMAGSGFLSTLIAVRLEQSGQSAAVIGFVATSYFAGLTMGSLRATRVAQMLNDTPEIVEADHVTEEDCFLAKVMVSDIQ